MDEVTKDQRTAAKRINFGLMYGRGASSLSAQLGTDEERGRQLIDEYFANYPKVQRFLQRTANRAMRDRDTTNARRSGTQVRQRPRGRRPGRHAP